MDWRLNLAKAVPMSDVPALVQLIQGEVIGDYAMTGFPVPRAMIGQHPWFGIKPRRLAPTRYASGLLEHPIVGGPPADLHNPFAVLVEWDLAWLDQALDIDVEGLRPMVQPAEIVGNPEPVAVPDFEQVAPPLPRREIERSGLLKRLATVLLPGDFGGSMMESFVESTMRWFLAGVTRDSASAALSNCTVVAMRSDQIQFNEDPAGNPVVYVTVSDGSGNFEVQVSSKVPHQLTGYKVGAPDVAGITRNDVMPTERG
jgi:hypothetical protein